MSLWYKFPSAGCGLVGGACRDISEVQIPLALKDLWLLCYGYCVLVIVLWLLCCGYCVMVIVLWLLFYGYCVVVIVLWSLCCGYYVVSNIYVCSCSMLF